MISKQPDELKEAVNLLREFEKPGSHKKKTRNFTDAIDILNDYVKENPESPHLDFIENIRTSYTRILLQQLADIREIEIDDWHNYYTLMTLKVEDEVTKILSEDPILIEGYQEFLSMWIHDVIAILKGLLN